MYLAGPWNTLEAMHAGATATQWRLGHRPGLDGLRGVAILLVVASHLGVKHLEPLGGIGVTVFFTLSGFLITALLLGEIDQTGQVSVGSFYRRRFFRLAPAFLLMLAVVVPLEVGLYGQAPYWWAPLAEVSNWVSATQSPGALLMLHHTWSLSIEEQFYVLWPLLMWASMRMAGRRGVLIVAAGGIVLSMAAGLLTTGPRHSFGTDVNAVSLLAGCALAALMVDRTVIRAPRLAMPTAVVLVAVAAVGHVPAPLVPAATVLAIWTVSTRRTDWLSWAPLRGAGRISYGWYLWNYPVALLAIRGGSSMLLVPLVSLGIALASWYLIEQPASRFGRPAPERVSGGSGVRRELGV
jgi:peptidoglycan/LPS O-acetylase OafA/YrhL